MLVWGSVNLAYRIKEPLFIHIFLGSLRICSDNGLNQSRLRDWFLNRRSICLENSRFLGFPVTLY